MHKEADEASIGATVDGLNGASRSCEIILGRSGIRSDPLISGTQARFYSERCYLAQATLSRLLEIYEKKETRGSNSPLTMFVNDLLGLNHLDALVKGLHVAGDIRRLRTALPVYWEVRETIAELENGISADTEELERIDCEIKAASDRLASKLNGLPVQDARSTSDVELKRVLESRPEESKLQQLARLRLDIAVAHNEWQAIKLSVDTVERQNLERASADANAALESWRLSTGGGLESLFTRLSEFFSDLPWPGSVGPERACAAALITLRDELNRCASVLARETEDAASIAKLEQDVVRARERTAALDEQIAGQSAESGTLALLLADIVQHIKSDDCPVCGRNFSESSTEPLESYVSKRIAALTDSAGRLKSLMRERAAGIRAFSDVERQRAGIAARQMMAAARDELKRRYAQLAELKGALTKIESDAISGEQIIAVATAASLRLSELRSRDQRATIIRESAARFAHELGLSPVGETESLESALERVQAELGERESTLIAHQSMRQSVLADLSEPQKMMKKRTAIESAYIKKQGRLQRLRSSRKKADMRIEAVRELVRRVRETRTVIVRRVFNESLNAVWRDLFVRLAPDEPFVPAFALPDVQARPVEAVLETLYRSGGKGGNPRAMLSSGNLNTAALTLFLALHLSVKPTLPWLVIRRPCPEHG